LNFKTVRGGYAAVNEYTEKLLAVLRFKQVGTYKEMFWADGKYQDYVICQISAEDWLKSHAISPADKLETGKSNG